MKRGGKKRREEEGKGNELWEKGRVNCYRREKKTFREKDL